MIDSERITVTSSFHCGNFESFSDQSSFKSPCAFMNDDPIKSITSEERLSFPCGSHLTLHVCAQGLSVVEFHGTLKAAKGKCGLFKNCTSCCSVPTAAGPECIYQLPSLTTAGTFQPNRILSFVSHSRTFRMGVSFLGLWIMTLPSAGTLLSVS